MPAGSDPYYYPGTKVLRNRLRIFDPVDLARAEDDITAAAIFQLERDPIPGAFDLDHLRRIHHAIFDSIYPWAGQIRTVDFTKGGAPFCGANQIVDAAHQVFGRLRDENHLVGLPRDRVVDRITAYHGAVNYLHPFPEGNGRAQRAFLGQLARNAGYVIRWDLLDPAINEYASHQQRTLATSQPMRLVFDEIVEDHRPGAVVERAIEAARLQLLAHQVRVDAAAHEATARRLRTEAAQGRGRHVVELVERRNELDGRVRAIQELDDADLGRRQLTGEQAGRFDRIAGPEPGRANTLLEYHTLTARWKSLYASAQALDGLAAERPADLALRQHARADRITQRATIQMEQAVDFEAAKSAAERLRTARHAAGPVPDRDHTAASYNFRSVDMNTAGSARFAPTLEPPESTVGRYPGEEVAHPTVELAPDDGIGVEP